MRSTTLSLAAATVGGFAVTAFSQTIPPEIVLASGSHSATSPKTLVSSVGTFPGLGTTAKFKTFANWMGRSPDGSKQLFTVALDLASVSPALNGQTDQLILVRDNGVWRIDAQEGVTQIDATRYLGMSSASLSVPINDSGAWALLSRTHLAGGVADAIGNSPDRVVRYTPTLPAGSRFSVIAAANGNAESAFGAGTGAVWGANTSSTTFPLSGVGISNAGEVSFLARSLPSPAPAVAIVAGSATIVPVASGSTTPTNQADVPGVPILDIPQLQHAASADGLHRIYRGTVNTTVPSQNVVVVVDNEVKYQRGSTLPGFPSAIDSFPLIFMEGDGTWFVVGRNADGIDWVSRNGVIIAVEGTPAAPGYPENWSTFTDVHGDAAGRWVIMGTTNAAAAVNDIIVGSTGRVLAKEGAGVDLDSDGAADAGLFLSQFNDRGSFIGSDLRVYFAARLKTTATGSTQITTDQSLLRVRMCWADYNDNGQIDLLDIFAFLADWFAASPKADFTQANGVDLLDIFAFLSGWFSGC